MNEPSSTAARPVLVWDLPVRVFHWLLALSFAGAYLTAESDGWRVVHVTLGYTVAGLVVFRLLWGLVGTRHARFAAFVRGPKAAARYLGSLLSRRPEHHTGHNPAGALAVVGLLALAALVALTGWLNLQEIGGKALEELHEGLANTMLALVLVHLAGVVVGSWRHRENLVRAMVTGRKPAAAGDAIGSTRRGIGVAVLVAVLGFWAWQWQTAPAPAAGAAAERHHAGDRDDDD